MTSNEELVELYLKPNDNKQEIETLADIKEDVGIKIIQDSNTFLTKIDYNNFNNLGNGLNLNNTQFSANNIGVGNNNMDFITNTTNLNKSMLNININSPIMLETNIKKNKNNKDDLNNSNDISYSNIYIDKVNRRNSNNKVPTLKVIDLADTSLGNINNQSNSFEPINSTKINNSNISPNSNLNVVNNIQTTSSVIITDPSIILSFTDYKVEENEIYIKFKKDNKSKW